MTVAALKNSFYINGVSKLHAGVSRKMWQNIWKDIPEDHIPIQAITNGIHTASWMSFDMMELMDRHFGKNWQEKQDSASFWKGILEVPDAELWKVHEIRRKKLINFTRRRLKKQLLKKGSSRLLIQQAQDVLDYNTLTIGLARRFATYKRGDLILREPEKLLRLINDSQRPIQLIFAGKAHPQDNAGKEIIKNIIHFINSHQLTQKVVFIEDYDINVARYMVQGVDVWLNNPLRPFEACGTSGMKAAVNGVLNFSVLDGWWDEAYNQSNGWVIGRGEIYQDKDYQSQVESKVMYSILEDEIIPRFYDRRKNGLPGEWIKMMKESFLSLASVYNTHRMVKDYYSRFYKNAARFYQNQSENRFEEIRAFVKWKNILEKEFNKIKIEKFDFDRQVFQIGEEFEIEAEVFLGGIDPRDIRVDVYHGNVALNGRIEEASLINLQDFTPLGGQIYRFSGRMVCQKTGEQAFRLRIIPFHPLCPDPYEMNLVKWG
jgi:starch phosphorylase